MKGICKFVTCTVVFLLLCISFAFAQSDQRVFDNAELLLEHEIKDLENRIIKFTEKHNMDAVMLTILDAEGKSAREYADDFYDKNNYGVGESYDGLLILIDMDNREIYISTSGRMIEILTDNRINNILDGQFDRVVKGDYYGALVYGITAVESYTQTGPVAGQYSIDENDVATERRGLTLEWVLLSVAAGLAVGGIAVLGVSVYYKKDFHSVAYDYRTNCKLSLLQKNDILVNSYVNTRRIPTNTSSGGSTRSTTHISSSGRTHGGGGRKF